MCAVVNKQEKRCVHGCWFVLDRDSKQKISRPVFDPLDFGLILPHPSTGWFCEYSFQSVDGSRECKPADCCGVWMCNGIPHGGDVPHSVSTDSPAYTA